MIRSDAVLAHKTKASLSTHGGNAIFLITTHQLTKYLSELYSQYSNSFCTLCENIRREDKEQEMVVKASSGKPEPFRFLIRYILFTSQFTVRIEYYLVALFVDACHYDIKAGKMRVIKT